MPLCLNAKMSQDGVNSIRLWQRSPVDLLRSRILEIFLEAIPDPFMHLDHELQSLVHTRLLLTAKCIPREMAALVKSNAGLLTERPTPSSSAALPQPGGHSSGGMFGAAV